jgi:hypothetical protein
VLVKALEQHLEINKVNYWKRDATTDISKFMFEEIVKCDDFVVFCTEDSFCSKAVRQEWDFALRLGKRIIPVFEEITNVPKSIRMKRGIIVSKLSKKKRKKLSESKISKLIEDLKRLILDTSNIVPDFEEYQKILNKIKDDSLIREFVSNFYTKIDATELK